MTLEHVERIGCPACSPSRHQPIPGPGCDQCAGHGWVYVVPDHLPLEEVERQKAALERPFGDLTEEDIERFAREADEGYSPLVLGAQRQPPPVDELARAIRERDAAQRIAETAISLAEFLVPWVPDFQKKRFRDEIADLKRLNNQVGR